PDHGRRLRAGLGLLGRRRARRRARGDVHAPPHLGRPAREAGARSARGGARPARRRARARAAAPPRAARTVVLAGARERELVRGRSRTAGDREGLPVIPTPTVDWLALSPTLALLAGAAVALLSALLPDWLRKGTAAIAAFAGFAVAAGFAIAVFDRSPTPETLLAGSMTRDQLAAM